MRRKQLHWLVSWAPVLLVMLAGIVEAQTGSNTRLQIWLRYGDGTAVTGETIILERLPEEEPMPCVTDAGGVCTWLVGQGLYQVLFTRPLDDISALAVAEGGLRGLGLTVGNEDIGDASIAYHFTFHSDGRVYFDSAPEAVVPVPLVPVGEAWHGGIAPSPIPTVTETEPANAAAPPPPTPTSTPDTAVPSPPSGSFWHLLLFFGGGLALGGCIHWWSRRRRLSATYPTVIVEYNREEHDA